MELLQRTLYHHEQRHVAPHRPARTLLHERSFALRWADLSLKGVVRNLFNVEYVTVLSRPMPRLNYEIFLDIRPKFHTRKR